MNYLCIAGSRDHIHVYLGGIRDWMLDETLSLFVFGRLRTGCRKNIVMRW